jgi:tetratricopeptide (TPR) repeat protein
MFDVRALLAVLRREVPARNAFERGSAELAAGRHAAALGHFEEALRLAAGACERAAVLNKLGVARIGLGLRAEALDAFCAALKEDETAAPALANIGTLLFEDGHVLDALDYYDGAIRADERYAVAHRNRSAALRKLGRRAESVSALKTAARLEGRPGRERA